MEVLFTSVIPLLLLLATPALQIYVCSLRVKGKIKLSFLVIAMVALVAGGLCSALAGSVVEYGTGPNVKYDIGGLEVEMLGLLLTAIIAPIISVVSYLSYRLKNKATE
jgi:hypothetical protein